MRPCQHAGQPPDPACPVCRWCLSRHPKAAVMRARWGEPEPAGPAPAPKATAPKAPPDLSCVHRGEPTGDLVACPTCRGTVRLKLFACALAAHPLCVIDRPAPGVACFARCPDRRSG